MLGFDTETVNRKGGGHVCLLTCSDGRFKEFPKTFDDIFCFLAQKNNSSSGYMAWNMDFDARAILHEKFLPYRVLEALTIGGVARWKFYRIKYIPRKYVRVSRNNRLGFELYDLAQYYGMRLADAAKSFLGTDLKQEIPESWYREMDRCLRDSRRETIIRYALQDSSLVQKLFGILRQSFDGMGLRPKRWISPASISVLKFKEALDAEPKIPYPIQEIFRRSFYGGRIEVQGLGNPGLRRAYLYDIRSAYPASASRLLSLSGLHGVSSFMGSWKFNKLAVYGAYEVEAEIPEDWTWGPFAVRRRDGEIIYPVGKVETWVGLGGIKLLQKYSLGFRVKTAYEYLRAPGTEPKLIFKEIPALYLERKNPAVSLAIKLVLNSLYGKLAENLDRRVLDISRGDSRAHGMVRVRTIHGMGRYTNYILASAITEETRLKLWKNLQLHGKRAYMCMTDSILTSVPIKTGSLLGDWSLKLKVSEAVILGSGRYWLVGTGSDGQRNEDFRFRGFTPRREVLASLRRCGKRFYEISDLRTGSLLQWARRAGVDDLNVLENVPLKFELGDEKRYYEQEPESIAQSFHSFYPSKPYIMERGKRIWTDKERFDYA